MVFDTIKAVATSLMAPFRAKPSFIVHGTRPARYGDDKFYPPPTPPGTPTSMDSQRNQSFNDEWKMPRGLVWKTYWQRALDDVKYHTLVVYAHVFRETNIGLVLVFLALILTSIVSCNSFAIVRVSRHAR
jgi:sensor histidine kinase YesM